MDDARSRPPGVRTLRVLTPCDGALSLVERYARDVSGAGLFVRTREAFEVGAAVRFEYLLADGRCALAGEGRVAFLRAEGERGARSAGVGVAIDKLRKGDRAVVERMTAARAGAPSRFEHPEGPPSTMPPPPEPAPLRPDALFADVKLGGANVPPEVAAYLSADLTTDLPTIRPPVSGAAPGWLAEAPPSADLADQLEPSPAERGASLDATEADADVDATPLFVPLEVMPPAPSAPSTPSDRPGPPHDLDRPLHPQEVEPTAPGRASDPERDRRFAALVASATLERPPVARGAGVLLVLLLLGLSLALLVLFFTRAA
jgi:Tfp pilus assembly protein PilZ